MYPNNKNSVGKVRPHTSLDHHIHLPVLQNLLNLQLITTAQVTLLDEEKIPGVNTLWLIEWFMSHRWTHQLSQLLTLIDLACFLSQHDPGLDDPYIAPLQISTLFDIQQDITYYTEMVGISYLIYHADPKTAVEFHHFFALLIQIQEEGVKPIWTEISPPLIQIALILTDHDTFNFEVLQQLVNVGKRVEISHYDKIFKRLGQSRGFHEHYSDISYHSAQLFNKHNPTPITTKEGEKEKPSLLEPIKCSCCEIYPGNFM